jgi:5-formyltetrahydrofolate cyclo-ligase
MTDEPPPTDDVATAKNAVRQRIWSLLDERGAVQPPGSAGHIPSFIGAEAAARRLAELPEWQAARVVKANPDRAQLPIRVAALAAGKLLYMAVPRLETVEPFYRLDPQQLDPAVDLSRVATGQGAAEVAPRVSLDEMDPVDFIVCGSVAVDRRGVRLGKGAGYSDIEVGLLVDAGLIVLGTTIATTVHDLQVVDEPIPASPHDFRVRYIVTPTRVIECPLPPPPRGIEWDEISSEQIASIPVLGRSARVQS